MAERIHPLAALAAASPASEAVRLAALPQPFRYALRGAPPAGARLNRALAQGEATLLMLGPDECLLLAPAPRDLPGAVDVSHRSAMIEVAGPFAIPALNAFVALDLAEPAFPAGMCTRTLLGKAEIVLWRVAAETFRIDVARSLAPHVWLCLEEARREFL